MEMPRQSRSTAAEGEEERDGGEAALRRREAASSGPPAGALTTPARLGEAYTVHLEALRAEPTFKALTAPGANSR